LKVIKAIIIITLCSLCAALTTRSCHRVCCTESRGMRGSRAGAGCGSV